MIFLSLILMMGSQPSYPVQIAIAIGIDKSELLQNASQAAINQEYVITF